MIHKTVKSNGIVFEFSKFFTTSDFLFGFISCMTCAVVRSLIVAFWHWNQPLHPQIQNNNLILISVSSQPVTWVPTNDNKINQGMERIGTFILFIKSAILFTKSEILRFDVPSLTISWDKCLCLFCSYQPRLCTCAIGLNRVWCPYLKLGLYVHLLLFGIIFIINTVELQVQVHGAIDLESSNDGHWRQSWNWASSCWDSFQILFDQICCSIRGEWL